MTGDCCREQRVCDAAGGLQWEARRPPPEREWGGRSWWGGSSGPQGRSDRGHRSLRRLSFGRLRPLSLQSDTRPTVRWGRKVGAKVCTDQLSSITGVYYLLYTNINQCHLNHFLTKGYSKGGTDRILPPN